MNVDKIIRNLDIKKAGGVVILLAGGVALYLFVKWQIKKKKEHDKSVEGMFENIDLEKAAKTATLTKEQAGVIANKIKNAWGFLNDDEEAIYQAMKQVKNSSDLAMIMNLYSYKGEDLATSLGTRLTVAERAKVNEIIKSNGLDLEF